MTLVLEWLMRNGCLQNSHSFALHYDDTIEGKTFLHWAQLFSKRIQKLTNYELAFSELPKSTKDHHCPNVFQMNYVVFSQGTKSKTYNRF